MTADKTGQGKQRFSATQLQRVCLGSPPLDTVLVYTRTLQSAGAGPHQREPRQLTQPNRAREREGGSSPHPAHACGHEAGHTHLYGSNGVSGVGGGCRPFARASVRPPLPRTLPLATCFLRFGYAGYVNLALRRVQHNNESTSGSRAPQRTAGHTAVFASNIAVRLRQRQRQRQEDTSLTRAAGSLKCPRPCQDTTSTQPGPQNRKQLAVNNTRDLRVEAATWRVKHTHTQTQAPTSCCLLARCACSRTFIPSFKISRFKMIICLE